MGQIVDTALQNPIFLGVGILLLAGLVLSLVLKLAKLAVFILIVFGCYVGYLHYTGQELPPEIKRIEEQASTAAGVVRDKAEELGTRVQEELERATAEESADVRPGADVTADSVPKNQNASNEKKTTEEQ